VTLIVDLTHESDRLAPYASHVGTPLRRVNVPVRDLHAPKLDDLIPTLDLIDEEIGAGGLVYIHCWGGCGRTGAVVASWLVKQGWTAEEALDRYADASRDVCGRRCTERPSQFELVRKYAATVSAAPVSVRERMDSITAQQLRDTAREALSLAATCHERAETVAGDAEGDVWKEPLEDLAKLLRLHALALEREVDLHEEP
jgi:hypothetical protein